jgi:quercetin dioxygenase-like cupin family protein
LTVEVQVDDGDVRVSRWTLATGEETGMHTHEHDYVVVPVAAGVMGITAADGTRAVAEISAGVSYARKAGMTHNVANAGTAGQVLDFVEIEVIR